MVEVVGVVDGLLFDGRILLWVIVDYCIGSGEI